MCELLKWNEIKIHDYRNIDLSRNNWAIDYLLDSIQAVYLTYGSLGIVDFLILILFKFEKQE